MIEKLIEMMPPPKEPSETGTADGWKRIEEVLGTVLPQDYKNFIDTYGTGNFGDYLWIYNPFSKSHHLNLITRAAKILASTRNRKEALTGKLREELYPDALYPEADGILPWGHTIDGDYVFWQTTGHPDQWTVVAVETRGPDIDRYHGSMTSFLAGILTGKVKSKVVPANYIDRNSLFMSVTPTLEDKS